ncbi:MAG: RHS repeat-associated core domain-containing protein, partial [Saprospiraceae bacterium]
STCEGGDDESSKQCECFYENNCVDVLYYYHSDHIGSRTFLTDALGIPYETPMTDCQAQRTMIYGVPSDHKNMHSESAKLKNTDEFMLYLPFGEAMGHQKVAGWATPYTFTGKEQDAATGLHYFGARYLDTRLSMWFGVDPLAEKYLGWSPYNYVLNNPVSLIDPTGLSPEEPPVNGLEYYADESGAYYWNKENNNYDKYKVIDGTEVKFGTYNADEFTEPKGNFTIYFDLYGNNKPDKFNPAHTIATLSGALMASLAAEEKPWIDISNESKYPGVKIMSHKDMIGAVTFGNMIFTNPRMQDRNTLDHEYGHYLDFKLHFKFDKIAYLSKIGLSSFISATRATLSNYNHDNSIPEKRANILGSAWSGNKSLYKR